MNDAKSLIIIPARIGSVRLANKPLIDINGKPMVIQVACRAREADIGPVIIATDCPNIAQLCQEAGFLAILTKKSHPSGSDRVFEALCHYDSKGEYQHILNIQGDMPFIDPRSIALLAKLLQNSAADIVTLGAPIHSESEKQDPNIVKIIASKRAENRYKALYFTRSSAPFGLANSFHHIGVYGFKRASLEKFIQLPNSTLEQQEKLEQLRALENDMYIEVAMIDKAPISIDSAQDLALLRQSLA